MPKIVSRTDVLAPQKTITFTYKGKNPYDAMSKAEDLILEAFNIPGTGKYELELDYDTSDPSSISFSGLWRGESDKEDNYSQIVVLVKASGSQDKQTKEGEVTVWITPYLVTEYEYNNSFSKMLWLLRSKMFYDRKRKKYIEKARRQTEKAKRLLTEEFGVELKMRGSI